MRSSVTLMYVLIKHFDKRPKHFCRWTRGVISCTSEVLSLLTAIAMHVGPIHSSDSCSVFLHFPLEVNISAARASWRTCVYIVLPSNHGPIWSGIPDASAHGRITMEVCIRFLLSPWSLIKCAQPHSERRVTVTGRARRSHAGKVRSRCATSQVERSEVRRTSNWRDLQN